MFYQEEQEFGAGAAQVQDGSGWRLRVQRQPDGVGGPGHQGQGSVLQQPVSGFSKGPLL